MKYKIKQTILLINSIISNITRYIIKIIIPVIILCIGINVKAETIISHYMCGNSSVDCNSTFNQNSYITYGQIYSNQGAKVFPNLTGYVVFTFTSWEPYSTNAWPLKGVNIRANNGNTVYACEIGSLGGWNDSSTQWQIFSAKCPVSFNENGLYDIQFERMNATNYKYIQRNEIITMVASESDANSIISANQQAVQQQIQNANANTTAITNAITNSTTREIDAIISQQTQQHQDHEDLMRDTRTEQEKQPVDTTEIEDMRDAEAEMITELEENENIAYNPQFSWDDNAFEWIWYVLNRVVNTHTKIFNMLIAILGIGFAKLLLCR